MTAARSEQFRGEEGSIVMAKLKSALRTAAMIVSTLAVSPPILAQAGPADPIQSDAVQAISVPSADITLSFVVPGRLSEVSIKEGDFVPKGKVLACLDDQPERIQAQQYKVQAGDKTKILSAEADLAQKKLDLKKVESAKAKGAASDWEIEHLMVNVRMADLALKAAILEQELNQHRYTQAMSQLERMRLVSPIAGRVEKLSVETGEAVNALGAVVQLVKIDPLWIDVPVPLAQAKKLALGQNVRVQFPDAEGAPSSKGKIIHIAAVADAASDTLGIRIEVPNPHNRPAGERVSVAFAPNEDDHHQARLRTK
jgi:RND family efflux transporter MFP subunit